MHRFRYSILLAIFLAAVPVILGAGLKIELPPESDVFKPGTHADLVNANCLICHSSDYVSIQPPLSRTAWRAIVVKMQDKYGASMATNSIELLADYLVQHYGTVSPKDPPASSEIHGDVSPPNLDGSQLTVKFACVGCHNAESKMVGPAWKQIAEKYKNDPAAKEKIADQIMHGGSGKWGTIPMPPFTTISALEIKTLIDWILAR